MINGLISQVRGQLKSAIPRHNEQKSLALAAIFAIGVFSIVSFGGKETIARLPGPPRFVIDPNEATEAELLLLPRVGPSLAKAILDERAKRPFENARDVGRTRGIGEKTLGKLLPHLTVKGASGSGQSSP